MEGMDLGGVIFVYQGKKILAIIPIRSGSKTIKNLNMYPIYNIPLFKLSYEQAKMSKYIDTVCVSVDCMKYALLAEQNGVCIPFIRPKELARDNTKLIETIVHARDFYVRNRDKYDIIVTLMATAPLRSVEDIDGAIEAYYNGGERPIVSITDCDIIPQLVRYVDESGNLKTLVNMNSTYNKFLLPKYYKINESIYVNNFDKIDLKTSINDNNAYFYMPPERSVSIKTLEDIRTVRHFIKSKKVSEQINNK